MTGSAVPGLGSTRRMLVTLDVTPDDVSSSLGFCGVSGSCFGINSAGTSPGVFG